jgi:2-oxoglutarate/2-oxoacid ferredoxin oxidoreductase subunit beta
MNSNNYDIDGIDVAWCPGCGNFDILKIVKEALAQLDISPTDLVFVSGIGQAAKTPQYLKCNYFNGLHGRALPPATAIKAANPNLTVIAESGDGCSYGEGGNHFIHTIRRNPDITLIVHNNMIYGLTKGQASPTSEYKFITPVQPDGVASEPFNPVAVAVALDASFVARAFSGDITQSVEIVKAAISHKGFSIVDILQPCVSFNKINNFKWFKDRIYYPESSYDPTDRVAAFKKAIITDKIPLGIIYTNSGRKTFEQNIPLYDNDNTPLWKRSRDGAKFGRLIESKRS